jgi:hypothetical protein
MSPRLHGLLRQTVEDLRRFPLPVAMRLSQQFAGHGLQFFKVNRTVTHVCVARPHYLDLEVTVVSDGVRRIVEFINSHPNCTRRSLLGALAPSATAPPAASTLPPPASPANIAAQAETATPAADAAGTAAAVPQVPAQPEVPPPTPEQTAVIADLHWLIHQGHVIEYTTGKLETAKAPKPRPAPPSPPLAEAAPAAGDAPVQGAGAVAAAPESTAAATAPTLTSLPDPTAEGAQPVPDAPAAAALPVDPLPEAAAAPPPVAETGGEGVPFVDTASQDTVLMTAKPAEAPSAPAPETVPPPAPGA